MFKFRFLIDFFENQTIFENSKFVFFIYGEDLTIYYPKSTNGVPIPVLLIVYILIYILNLPR